MGVCIGPYFMLLTKSSLQPSSLALPTAPWLPSMAQCLFSPTLTSFTFKAWGLGSLLRELNANSLNAFQESGSLGAFPACLLRFHASTQEQGTEAGVVEPGLQGCTCWGLCISFGIKTKTKFSACEVGWRSSSLSEPSGQKCQGLRFLPTWVINASQPNHQGLLFHSLHSAQRHPIGPAGPVPGEGAPASAAGAGEHPGMRGNSACSGGTLGHLGVGRMKGPAEATFDPKLQLCREQGSEPGPGWTAHCIVPPGGEHPESDL